MDNGWIKLHRKTLECGFFNNPDLHHFWTWCLLKATHKAHKQSVGFQLVQLEPGQFIFGRKTAVVETGLSERTIRTSLQHLINLENLTSKPTNKFSVVTVCNWATYQNKEEANDQQNDQQATSRRPAGDHKQECKEGKEGKKVAVEPFEALWSEYPKKDGRKDAQRHFNASVKTAQDWDNIRTALRNYKNSPNVKRGFIKNGSTWFNNWQDWVNPTPEMMNDQKDGGLIRDL